MAQTGYTPIQLYYSSTTTNAPLAANLASGELAINITDGKLFYKDNANAIQVIGWKVRPATAGGTGLTSFAVGDLIYANTTTTLASLADVATGNALISGGVSTAPSWGKIGLTTHVSGVLPIANGGTNASTASITSFNNITGYTASGATGTTSTNLVFSTSPSITTPTLIGDATLSTGNLVVGTSGKGITNSTGSVKLNFSTAGTALSGAQSVYTGDFYNVGTAQTITITDTNGGYIVITGVQGGVGSSTWTLPFVKRGGSIAIGTASKAILTADPILSVGTSSGNITVTPLAANTYITYAIYYTPLAL